MISEYIIQLLQSMSEQVSKSIPREMDLVLSGGAFNGSYMLGSLYYLKELEERNQIRFTKISGSSIGSVLGLLYCTNQLDLFNEFYQLCFADVMEHLNLSKLLQLKHLLKERLPTNVCDLVRHRLYVSYHNIQTGKKCVKHSYRSVDALLDCIVRSCYIPFLIDYNVAYQQKYIDGMLPYFIKGKRKVMYINIFTYDKIHSALAIKNEHTNVHRILAGINDVHLFFIKQQNTCMCSYVDQWGLYEYVSHWIAWMVQQYVVYLFYYTKDIYDYPLVKKMLRKFTHRLIDAYIHR